MQIKPLNLAVLVSGSGTTLQNIVDLISDGSLNARVKLVIGSKPQLVGIDRARKANLPSFVVDRRTFPDVAFFSARIFELIDSSDVDLICLAGWLCLLDVPAKWHGKILNIHPALLPSFGGKGMYGRRVHEAVIAHGCKVSGCTVHFVDGSYDTGPIVIQRTCPVLNTDSPEDLAHRVFEEEKIAYPEAIRLFAEGKLKLDGRRVIVG